MIVLDILANNDWKRPIYFVTGYHNDALGLEEYFQLEGLAYRLVPIKSQNRSWLEYGRIDTDILYDNVMNKFVWRGAKEKGVNIDYNHKRTLLVVKARYNHARLANALVAEGKNEKAIKVLDHCMEIFPVEKLSWDMYSPDLIESYYKAGAVEKANSLTREMTSAYFEKLDYFLKQKQNIIESADYEIRLSIDGITRVATAASEAKQEDLSKELTTKFDDYYRRYINSLQPQAR
jgi:tetratricopeptide (TPR) repeat protein